MKKIVLLVLFLSLFSSLLAYENALDVRTDVPGVSVYLDDKYLGISKMFDSDTLNVFYKDDIKPGTYILKCTYQDYEPYKETIEIKNEGTVKKEVNFLLKNIEVTDITEVGEGQQLRKTGTIFVRSKPTGATIHLNGRTVPNPNEKDKIILTDAKLDNISVGVIKVKCMFGSNKNLEGRFTLAAGDTVRVMADFFENIMTIKVKYKVTIASEPAGKIYLDGKYIGLGSETVRLSPGTYKVRIEKKGYKTISRTINISGEDLFTYKLESTSAPVEIKSKPESGAEVWIQGKMVGTTPYYDSQLEAGTYDVELRKNGYQTVKKQITIVAGKSFKDTILMNEYSGSVIIDAPNSLIYIDNNYFGKDKIVAKLTPGLHIISARRDYHYNDDKQVNIKLDEEISIQLEPKPKKGFVTVTAREIHTHKKADGLEIFVDNKNTNEVTQGTLELPIGDHFITLRNPDYRTVTKKVTIREKQNLHENFDVESFSWYRNKAKTWQTHGWIGTVSTILLAGTGFLMNTQANNAFDDYNNATNTEDALDFRDKTEKYENYRNVCYGSAGATCLYAIISWIVSGNYNSKAHPEVRQ